MPARFHRTLIVTVLLATATSVPAMEPGSADGSIRFQDQTFALNHAYTYFDEEGGRDIVVLSHEAVAAGEVEDVSAFNPHVILRVGPDDQSVGCSYGFTLIVEGLSANANDCELVAKRTENGNVEGRVNMSEEGSLGSMTYYFEAEYNAEKANP